MLKRFNFSEFAFWVLIIYVFVLLAIMIINRITVGSFLR